MQFTSFVSSIAAAGVLLASEAAGQQASSLSSSSMSMASNMAMPTAEPTLASEVALPTGGASKKMMTHKVMVSDQQGALKFTPNVVDAQPGHMIEFMFHPGNHSVAQAAFDKPCMPMDVAMPGMTGFFSGFNPITGSETKTFKIMVNDTKPMWFYCAQGKHCQDGMVGVINPPAGSTSQNVNMFAMAAKSASTNMAPSQIAGGVDHTGVARASGKAHHWGSAKGTGKMHMGGSGMWVKGTGRVGGVAKKTGAMKTLSLSASKIVVSTIKTVAPQAKPMNVSAIKSVAPEAKPMNVSAIKSVAPVDPVQMPAANAGSAGNGNNGNGAPAQAQAAVAPSSASAAASPSGTLKSANGAGSNLDMLASGSPISLVGLLAAAFYIYA